jgi:hypothetical protein
MKLTSLLTTALLLLEEAKMNAPMIKSMPIELDQLLKAQRAAFLCVGSPSYGQRISNLDKLKRAFYWQHKRRPANRARRRRPSRAGDFGARRQIARHH